MKRIPPPAPRRRIPPPPLPTVRQALIKAWNGMTKKQLVEELTIYLDRAMDEMPQTSRYLR